MTTENPLIPLSAIRPIAVEAIRSVTGCPDIRGNEGRYLVDELESVAKAASTALSRDSLLAKVADLERRLKHQRREIAILRGHKGPKLRDQSSTNSGHTKAPAMTPGEARALIASCVICCEAHDREPCPRQPERQCPTCPHRIAAQP